MTSVRFECGCVLEMGSGDPPVRAFECEHGNCIRAADPPTGADIYAYELWLRTTEAHDYFASMSSFDE